MDRGQVGRDQAGRNLEGKDLEGKDQVDKDQVAKGKVVQDLEEDQGLTKTITTNLISSKTRAKSSTGVSL